MWSTEIQHVLLKAYKILTIFFFIFLNFFGNFDETKQGKAKVVKQSVVERG
jgi:hypothetical protein